MSCLIITPEIRELAKKIQGETEESIKGLVSLWQEQNNKSIEEYPSVGELNKFRLQLRSNEIDKDTTKKYSFNTPKISTLEEQSNVDLEFTPQVRRDRVSLIARLFSNYVDSFIKNEGIVNRQDVFYKHSPAEIFKMVFEHFNSYVKESEENKINAELSAINSKKGSDKYTKEQKSTAAKSRVEYKTKEYEKIIRNYQPLAEEASSTLIITEGIRIDPAVTSVSKVNLNYDNPEGDSSLDELSEEWRLEESIKEGWMSNFREVSSHESLSQAVRKVIRQIPHLDYRGKVDRDDLGFVRYLDADYVHASLIDKLRDMITSKDMIPLLQNLSSTKKWVKQIIDTIQKDEALYSQFYQDFRKDFVNYWVQKKSVQPDGSFKMKTIAVNKPEGVYYLLDSWRDNYESGHKLDSDSIYDEKGNIIVENAEKGLKLTENLNNKFINLSTEDRLKLLEESETWNTILKLLNMIGIDANPSILKDSLTNIKSLEGINITDPIMILLPQLNIIFSGVKKGEISSEGGDLINTFGSAYNSIALMMSEVTEDAIESSITQDIGGKSKTFYSHIKPNYLGKLIKQLKDVIGDKERFETFINNEFKQYEWFFKDGKWLNDWLEQLSSSSDARKALSHKVVLSSDKIDYTNWDSLDYTLSLLTEYWGDPSNNRTSTKYAWYHVPILSDSPSAEFIKFRKYVSGVEYDADGNKLSYEDIILDKLTNLVLQEYNRISLVIARDKEFQKGNSSISPIANYDIIRNAEGKIENKGGAEFKFLPALNNIKTESGNTFIKELHRLITEGSGNDISNFIKDNLKTIMENGFNNELSTWKSIGLFDKLENGNYKNLPFKTEKNAVEALREYYWNSKLATSQIIQLTTTDLAFYKNVEDFQKRYKEVHAPSLRLNTKATFKGERIGRDIERTIYLKDNIITSNVISEIEEVLNAKVSKGEMPESEKKDILSKYKEVNVADAQAYRSLSSYRAILGMSGQWTDEMETAYNNLKNGTWNANDFNIIWQPKKPFVYTQVNNTSGLEGHTGIKTPVQHKNSEFLLLAIHSLVAGPLGTSGKLRALNDFMEKKGIDVVQFESAVKVGKQGVIDINGMDDYNQVFKTLNDATSINGIENPNVVHIISYEDYGIQTETPEHLVDIVQLIGTQIRKLITADIPDNATLTVNGKSFSKKEWLDLYNAINTENIIQSYSDVIEIFKNPKELEKILQEEIRGNQRYGIDMLKACTLDENGQFHIPLYDPVQAQRVQSLINSIIRSRITKQRIKGGALIQVTSWGVSKDLNIVFEGERENKRIKYVECYMPAYSKQFFEPFMKEGSHELDINSLPKELRELIGYRVPTEDKYSMLPLRIKGFLPQQNGSAIMLPADITTIAGSDFDVDKLYIMLPEFKISKYNMKKAREDFARENEIFSKIISAFSKSELLEDLLSEDTVEFKEWFNENKSKYLLDKPKFYKVKYDFNKKPQEQSIEARNNLIIDMMWSVLTHPDTASKILNPGGFDDQKSAARIIDILKSSSLEELSTLLNTNADNVVNVLNNISLKELNKLAGKLKTKLDPLAPSTQVQLHQQNMTGAKLIGIYANHNANHALMQHTELALDSEHGAFVLNGKKLISLHSITNQSGKYISRNNAGFLAASVDNAKDPILASLNQNTLTADASMLLSRLGYNALEIGLLMNQPIVLDITQTYFRENREGKDKDTIIDEILREYSKKAALMQNVSYDNYKNNNFLINELAKNIIISKEMVNITDASQTSDFDKVEFYKKQVAIGYLFKRILKSSDSLGQLVQITRADTSNGAVGASIADTDSKIRKAKDFLESYYTDETFPLVNANVIDVLDTKDASIDTIRTQILNSKLPFLQAFYTLGIEKTEDMLKSYFPYMNDSFGNVVNALREITKSGRLDTKTINSVYNDLLAYIMSSTEFFGSDSIINSEDKRRNFITSYPSEFKDIIAKNEDIAKLEFIKRLKVIRANSNNPVESIVFKNVGHLSPTLRERYMRDWSTLLYMNNPEAQKLALNLFRYSYYRNGFAFGPSTFIHLAPSTIRTAIPEYIDTLRELLTSEDDYSNFIEQYVYNHLDNRRLVPEIPDGTSIEFLDSNNNIKDIITVAIDESSSFKDKKTVRKKVKTSDGISYEFFQFIAKKIRGNYIYYKANFEGTILPNEMTYIRINPLGYKNNFLEYEYGKEASAMTSVIGRNTNTKELEGSEIGVYDSYSVPEMSEDDLAFQEEYSKSFNIDSLIESYSSYYGEDISSIKEDNDITSISPNEEFRDANDDVICSF